MFDALLSMQSQRAAVKCTADHSRGTEHYI